jgi:hypothetical protein
MNSESAASGKSEKNTGGRPRKFNEPSKVITVTLPLRTLSQLEAVSPDRAAAIVKVTDAALRTAGPTSRQVDVVTVLPGKAVILIGPSTHLKRIPWLQLVEVSPTRHLLVLPSGTPIESLEVALSDILETMPGDDWEREMLTDLRDKLTVLRRDRKMQKAEIIFVESPA